MVKIPGKLISFFTLPGIPFHEFSHWVACKISKVEVIKVAYLTSNLEGYVIHEFPSNLWKSLFITLSPLIIGYGVAISLCLIIAPSGGFIKPFTIWLAFSIAVHSFPSGEDINSLWTHAKGYIGVFYTDLGPVEIYNKAPMMPRILLFPSVLFLRTIDGLRPLWSDFILAFLILGPLLGLKLAE